MWRLRSTEDREERFETDGGVEETGGTIGKKGGGGSDPSFAIFGKVVVATKPAEALIC